MRQHNEKRAASLLKGAATEEKKEEDDESYEVTLDDDFLTALEYGMPPASGMVSVCLTHVLELSIVLYAQRYC